MVKNLKNKGELFRFNHVLRKIRREVKLTNRWHNITVLKNKYRGENNEDFY